MGRDLNDTAKEGGPDAVRLAVAKGRRISMRKSPAVAPARLMDQFDVPLHPQTHAARSNGHGDAKPFEAWLMVPASDIGRALEFPPQLVQDLACKGEVVMIYGEPESGKSTTALGMGVSLAAGTGFLGLQTRQCGVLYLAPEIAGVRQRLYAHMQHYGIGDIPLAVVAAPLDLFHGGLDALEHIEEAATRFEAACGHKVGAIFIDTLAVSLGDAQENDNSDMGHVFANVRLAAERTGATIFVIHHSVKSDPRMFRGAGGMGGAVEALIEVSHDRTADVRVIEVRKQKHLGTTGLRVAARFVRVEIGTDEWARPLTASVIEAADVPDTMPAKRMGEVEGAVVEFLAMHKVGIKKAEVVQHFKGRYEKGPIYRAMKTLEAARAIHQASGMVCIAEAAKGG